MMLRILGQYRESQGVWGGRVLLSWRSLGFVWALLIFVVDDGSDVHATMRVASYIPSKCDR